MIPKRFIRIWVGSKKIPARHEQWWQEFQEIHPGWKFTTLRDGSEEEFLSDDLLNIYYDGESGAARSNVLRLGALHELGGVYIDTDVMPVRPLDPLLEDPRPFIGFATTNSLQNAVIASPPKHPAMKYLLDSLPEWYWNRLGQSQEVFRSGPQFTSAFWMDRIDVRRLEKDVFYPCRRIAMEKFILCAFSNPKTYAAHYGAATWWKTKKEKR